MLHKKSLPADCQSYCWTYLQSHPLSSQCAWHIKLPSSSRRGSQRPSLESHDGHDKHPSIFPWLNRSKPERFPCRPVKHDHVYMPRALSKICLPHNTAQNKVPCLYQQSALSIIFSTSRANARHISLLPMLPKAHNAKPLTYWLSLAMSFLIEFVTSLNLLGNQQEALGCPRGANAYRT